MSPPLEKAVTLRAFLLAAGVTVVFSLTLPYFELWAGGGRAMCGMPYPAVWALLLLLLPLGLALRTLGRSWHFTPGEMLFAFSLVAISCLVPSMGLIDHLIPILTAPGYYGPREGFHDFLDVNTPSWLWPRNPDASVFFYEKVPPGGIAPWADWVRPLVAWGAFALLLYVAMAGLALLLVRQWVQHEHLAFPDLQMPAAVTEERRGIPGLPLISSVPLWVGFLIAAAIHTANGLHFYFPQVVPEIPMDTHLGTVWMAFHLALVGLAYLMPVDVSFSIWFFHVVFLAVRGAWDWFGFAAGGQYNLVAVYYNCSSGGFLALALFYLWRIVKLSRHGAREHRWERRFGLGLLGLGIAGMTFWLAAAGMTLSWGLSWIAIFLLGAIVMTRSVSEAGLFTTQVIAQPGATLTSSLGLAETLGPRNLSVMSFQDYANGADWGRGLIMPNIMQSLKLAMDRRWPMKRVILCVVLVLALAIPISCYATLSLFYERGASNAAGGISGWYLRHGNVSALKTPANCLQFPPPESVTTFNRIGFGVFAGITAMLVYLRSLFYWLPLHPLGFVLCGGYAVMRMFASVLVGWALKVSIMRYGGGRTYTALRPLFLGLILGDFLFMAFWGLINFLMDRTGYSPAIL